MSAPTPQPTRVVIPTVHLNGSSKEALLDKLRAVHEQLGATLAVLGSATPHGRDYYPQGERVILDALAQHMGWMREIEDLQRRVYAVWEGIDKQDG